MALQEQINQIRGVTHIHRIIDPVLKSFEGIITLCNPVGVQDSTPVIGLSQQKCNNTAWKKHNTAWASLIHLCFFWDNTLNPEQILNKTPDIKTMDHAWLEMANKKHLLCIWLSYSTT